MRNKNRKLSFLTIIFLIFALSMNLNGIPLLDGEMACPDLDADEPISSYAFNQNYTQDNVANYGMVLRQDFVNNSITNFSSSLTNNDTVYAPSPTDSNFDATQMSLNINDIHTFNYTFDEINSTSYNSSFDDRVSPTAG